MKSRTRIRKNAIVILLVLILTATFCSCGKEIKSASCRYGNYAKHKCEATGCTKQSVIQIKVGKEKYYFCAGHTDIAEEIYMTYMNGEKDLWPETESTGEEI